MAKNKITYSCFVEYHDTGEVKPLESLPTQEKERLAVYWGQRMANAFSEHFSQNPDEFARLCSNN